MHQIRALVMSYFPFRAAHEYQFDNGPGTLGAGDRPDIRTNVHRE